MWRDIFLFSPVFWNMGQNIRICWLLWKQKCRFCLKCLNTSKNENCCYVTLSFLGISPFIWHVTVCIANTLFNFLCTVTFVTTKLLEFLKICYHGNKTFQIKYFVMILISIKFQGDSFKLTRLIYRH